MGQFKERFYRGGRCVCCFSVCNVFVSETLVVDGDDVSELLSSDVSSGFFNLFGSADKSADEDEGDISGSVPSEGVDGSVCSIVCGCWLHPIRKTMDNVNIEIRGMAVSSQGNITLSANRNDCGWSDRNR